MCSTTYHVKIFADQTQDTLATLCDAYGASGFEQDVRKLLINYWADQEVAYKVDGMGNLLGWQKKQSIDKPTILVMAHMDEVGFLVSKINDGGFISLNPLGGWVDHVLWSQKWAIRKPDGHYIYSISGMDAPHVLSDFTKTPHADKSMLFLDTGLSKSELIEQGIRPGMPVVPAQRFQVLHGKKYAAKAFDDRAGLAVMIDLMRQINKDPSLLDQVNIVYAATVQEELGMRGSKTVYDSLKPDIVLNIEAGIARDYPTQFTKDDMPRLGMGPSLFVYDASMMPNQNLVQKIADVASLNRIPIQWELENSYGQDASCLQSAGKGMPAINIGIPIRYAHSHIGIMDRDDYDNTLRLLIHTIKALDKPTIAKLP